MSPAPTGLMVRLEVVAPETSPPSDSGMPPRRHWDVGEGVPDAATVIVALPPEQADWFAGCVVIDGPVLTVSVAAVLVAEPQAFVTMQSYEPASPAPTGLIVNAADVAPGI